MVIGLLRVENLRSFAAAELSLAPGVNLFLGANGAGKTSLLEAIYLLSHARSFRAGPKESLVRLGATGLSVFAEVASSRDEVRERIGLARVGSRWQARINGESPKSLDELLRKVAVVCFEPGTHELIAGAGEGRRSFLDWTLFHVEPEFLPNWNRYQRALKQRNSLLRSGTAPISLGPWNIELSRAGEELDDCRRRLPLGLFPWLAGRAELGRCPGPMRGPRSFSRIHDGRAASRRLEPRFRVGTAEGTSFAGAGQALRPRLRARAGNDSAGPSRTLANCVPG